MSKLIINLKLRPSSINYDQKEFLGENNSEFGSDPILVNEVISLFKKDVSDAKAQEGILNLVRYICLTKWQLTKVYNIVHNELAQHGELLPFANLVDKEIKYLGHTDIVGTHDEANIT